MNLDDKLLKIIKTDWGYRGGPREAVEKIKQVFELAQPIPEEKKPMPYYIDIKIAGSNGVTPINDSVYNKLGYRFETKEQQEALIAAIEIMLEELQDERGFGQTRIIDAVSKAYKLIQKES